jgi:poly-gamma-glutamate synthesis protein (capsule biosynthesis protein)
MKRARIRDRILILCCCVATAAILIAMAADFQHNTLAVDSIDHKVGVAATDHWSLQFTGDTMLGDGAQPLLTANGYDATVAAVKPLLDGDFTIVNAEAPIGLQTIPGDPGKAYSYNSDPRAAAGLRSAGIDALGLGNNHSLDMGLAGLRDTQRFAAANDLVTFGAGGNLAEAERPLLLHSAIGTVGVVALGENFGQRSRAAVANPGTVVFSPETIQHGYDLARAAGADWVVAYVHWGDNYEETNERERYWASVMVAAGFDAIVGTGPHIAAPIEFIDNVPVAYSLGNFAFGAPGRFKGFGKVGIGLLLSLELSKQAPAQLAVRCIATDNKTVDYVAQPCDDATTAVIMPQLNPQLVVQGNTARMPCNCLKPVGDEK